MIAPVSTSTLRIILLVLFAAHAVQLWGPLRVNTDAEHFLKCAAAASDSSQAIPIADSRPHPPGYATMVAVMDRAGAGSTPMLVGLNLVFVALGIFAALGLLRRGFGFAEDEALIVCAMTLLSFVVVKHSPIPLSDVPFFGLATGALYTLVRADQLGPARKRWMVLSVVLIILAISVRTIGVALLPALLWVSCGRRKQLATVLLVVGAALGGFVLSQSAYAAFAFRQFSSGEAWRTIISARLKEFGELALNVPASRLPDFLVQFVWVAGVILICAVVAGIAFWKSGGVIELYVIGFSGILLVWPFEDARFWLPVVPLLIAAAWIGLNAVPKLFSLTWASAYVTAGAAALIFSARLTFSGPEFGDRFGNGAQQLAYRAALHQGPVTSETDKEALAVLRRFEPRARQ
jgi:hypothetical protein